MRLKAVAIMSLQSSKSSQNLLLMKSLLVFRNGDESNLNLPYRLIMNKKSFRFPRRRKETNNSLFLASQELKMNIRILN